MKDKFKQLFNLPSNGFSTPIDLQDTEAGFSVYKEREQKGFKSLFRIYIKKSDFDKLDKLKSVTISGSYGKETSEGIILASNEFKRKVNWPIEFISEGEFFYNTENDKFYNKKGKEMSGMDLLLEADRLHTKPTKIINGAWLRIKLFWFNYLWAYIIKIIFGFLSGIQYLISGEKIRIFHNLTDPNKYSIPQTNRHLDSRKSELIDLWGYKVKPWIAVIYSIAHLTVYAILYEYDYKPMWLITIFKNNFLILMYGIITLGLANTILPSLLKPFDLRNVLKFIQSFYLKFAFRKIKI